VHHSLPSRVDALWEDIGVSSFSVQWMTATSGELLGRSIRQPIHVGRHVETGWLTSMLGASY
jgi:hypothetical protein